MFLPEGRKHKEAQAPTSTTTVQNCAKSEGRFQRFSENLSKKQEPQRSESDNVVEDTVKQERVYVTLQYTATFHCRGDQWKDCEELKSKRKEKWSFVDKRNGDGQKEHVRVVSLLRDDLLLKNWQNCWTKKC